MRAFIAIAGLAIFAAGAAALVGWRNTAPASAQVAGEAGAGLLAYDDAATIRRGAALYAAHCAACHGARLEGAADWRIPDAEGYLPAPPHDATGHTWHHPDEQLFLITKYGTAALAGADYKTRMEGFGATLSDTEIMDTLAFIKSTWPRQVIARHNRINAAAR